MNPLVKLVLFAALLLAMFAGGAALGAATQGDQAPTPPTTHTVHER